MGSFQLMFLKLTVAFRNFANAPKNWEYASFMFFFFSSQNLPRHAVNCVVNVLLWHFKSEQLCTLWSRRRRGNGLARNEV